MKVLTSITFYILAISRLSANEEHQAVKDDEVSVPIDTFEVVIRAICFHLLEDDLRGDFAEIINSEFKPANFSCLDESEVHLRLTHVDLRSFERAHELMTSMRVSSIPSYSKEEGTYIDCKCVCVVEFD